MPWSEERPRPNPDAVREALRQRDEAVQADGPDVEELEEDPAHEPDDEKLKDLNGG